MLFIQLPWILVPISRSNRHWSAGMTPAFYGILLIVEFQSYVSIRRPSVRYPSVIRPSVIRLSTVYRPYVPVFILTTSSNRVGVAH